jgi:aldehyde dehydrogenase (NAD+)
MTTSRQLFINGQWQDAAASFEVSNPANGELYTRAADADASDARRAIDAAGDAAAAWAATPYSQRARLLNKAADVVERRQQELAAALVAESGSWIGKAMFESGAAANVLRAAAAAAYQVKGEILPSDYGKLSMVIRQPLGVVAVISPWNFPLLLSTRGIAVAMAVGNTIVLKPSEETPVSGGLLLAECMEEAGIPAGVFNVVTCSRDHVAKVGEELVANPRVKAVSFTGSTAVGRQIGALAGGLLKKACLELGGKDAIIVLDDADIGRAVDVATFGCFMHQGQICMSGERILVHRDIADEFTRRFVANVKTLGVGNPAEMGNVIGPIINAKQLAGIESQVRDAEAHGARIETGGTYEGLFYSPTVLSGVTPEMRIFREETFGPVAAITVIENDEQAIALANDSEYGLSAGILTRNEERGLEIARKLETGMAHVNDAPVHDEAIVPFGGMKNSGLGRHGGTASIETFTEVRWVTVERGGRHLPPPFLEKAPA